MKVIGWLRQNEPLVKKPPEGHGIGFILNGVPYPMIRLSPEDADQIPKPPGAVGFPVVWAPYNEHYVRVHPTPQCDLELFSFRGELT